MVFIDECVIYIFSDIRMFATSIRLGFFNENPKNKIFEPMFIAISSRLFIDIPIDLGAHIRSDYHTEQFLSIFRHTSNSYPLGD